MKSISNTEHARQDATQFILLLIAVVSLLLTHIFFSALSEASTSSRPKTTFEQRFWFTPDVESDSGVPYVVTRTATNDKTTLSVAQAQLTSDLEIERRFVELAQRERLAREKSERLEAENRDLRMNLEDALHDIKDAQELVLNDFFPAHDTIAALKTVFDTSNAMRAALWMRDGVAPTTEMEVNMANEKLQVCEEQLTFVKTVATAAALRQIGDVAEREQFFESDPTIVELIDLIADASERCRQRIASCESGDGFAVQAYRDCRDYSDSLLWELSQHEAAAKFETPINGPWTQDAWELILARMNEDQFKYYDELFDHVVFLKDDPALSVVGAPPSASDDSYDDYSYEERYKYSYDGYDYYDYGNDAFEYAKHDLVKDLSSEPARHSNSDPYMDSTMVGDDNDDDNNADDDDDDDGRDVFFYDFPLNTVVKIQVDDYDATEYDYESEPDSEALPDYADMRKDLYGDDSDGDGDGGDHWPVMSEGKVNFDR